MLDIQIYFKTQTVVFTEFTIVQIIEAFRAEIQIRLMEGTTTHRYYFNLSPMAINLNLNIIM